jgi:hypothetical protein
MNVQNRQSDADQKIASLMKEASDLWNFAQTARAPSVKFLLEQEAAEREQRARALAQGADQVREHGMEETADYEQQRRHVFDCAIADGRTDQNLDRDRRRR